MNYLDNKSNTTLDIPCISPDGDEAFPDETRAGGLDWSNIHYEISNGKSDTRVILDEISGTAKRGKLLAIMGPSGSGKTTLLNCLSGRVSSGALTGSITLDGQPRHPATWKREMAFVEQDDHMYGHLTVRETLQYAARLRLPSSTYTTAEKFGKADQVLSSLRLDKAADTMIGDGLTRGVSGGERKRAAIGVQIISNPDLLMMDEPTSGLDATAALSVLTNVKREAERSGRIVILTIHQPSVEILEQFASVIILCAGKVAWMGGVQAGLEHFASLGYVCPIQKNPADFFLDIVTVNSNGGQAEEARIQTLQSAFASSKTFRLPAALSVTPHNPPAMTPRNGFFSELSTLFVREWLYVKRSKALLIADLSRTVILILLIGLASFHMELTQRGLQNRIGVLFVWPTNQMFVVLTPIITTFPLERVIMMRERAAGSYRVSSYYIAKFAALLIPALAYSLLATIPLYWMLGLTSNVTSFLTWLGINALIVGAAVSLGILVSAAVPTVQMAQAVGPLVVVVFMLFAGLVINITTVGWWFRWIHYISPVAYGFRALAQTELKDLVLSCRPGEACVSAGLAMLKVYDIDDISVGMCALMLSILITAWASLGYVVLRRTSNAKTIVL